MPLDTAAAEDRDLVLERIIDVPAEKLYTCWTTAELMPQWFCPKPWTVSNVRLDVRTGGNSYMEMNGPNGEVVPQPGVYLEVVPNQKLVFTDAFTETWKPSDKPFMVGIVTFEDLGDGKTRYRAVARHWTVEDKTAHEQMGFHEGWGVATDQLTALAKTLVTP
ncbi:SRPBCC family protein [Caulobacter sp. SL161]|uniref:SRPBCC family protein n=1 Tax=Caulobacter sp. SL161 TaxID=2995156 RepID=UPI002276E97B|nr:SRPBCC family protein [Caulobacter sp. SL161]MCY1648970.1 SRPBCC family protein [Caulobacter sp. SL161]